MEYYRVKPQYGDTSRIVWNRNHTQAHNDGFLVANELYTPCERNRLKNGSQCFEKVNISQRKTYQFFGARLAERNV